MAEFAAARTDGRESAPGGACPYLGLPDDPATHCAYPAPVHRCFRTGQPATIELMHQSERCLSPDFHGCPVYSSPPGRARGGGRYTALLSRRPARWRRATGAAALGAALLVAGIGIAGAGGMGFGFGEEERHAPPAVTPVTPRRYVVKPGDSLRGIADFFGVHPDDVAALNNLSPDRTLPPATILILPTPWPSAR